MVCPDLPGPRAGLAARKHALSGLLRAMASNNPRSWLCFGQPEAQVAIEQLPLCLHQQLYTKRLFHPAGWHLSRHQPPTEVGQTLHRHTELHNAKACCRHLWLWCSVQPLHPIGREELPNGHLKSQNIMGLHHHPGCVGLCQL